MVTFIPPYMGEEIKSNAEKKMYDLVDVDSIQDKSFSRFMYIAGTRARTPFCMEWF